MTSRVEGVGIEPGHYAAWVLDLPGCFARAPSLQEALSRTAESIYIMSSEYEARPVAAGGRSLVVQDFFDEGAEFACRKRLL